MRPLRYSINVTLDGCCDHREGIADEELHRHAAENIAQADALLFGRVTYEMMEAAWRLSTRTVTMQLLVGDPFTMIAAPVQCDVDGIPKRSHRVRGSLNSAIQRLDANFRPVAQYH
jgi:dihydrofolate reductase